MKTPFLIATLALCLTCSVWSKADDADSTPPAGGEHHHFGPQLSADDRAKLKAAHDAALAANPDLATQEKQLRDGWKDYEQKMHDAMVKADPTVEPILEKFHHHGPPSGGGDGGNQ